MTTPFYKKDKKAKEEEEYVPSEVAQKYAPGAQDKKDSKKEDSEEEGTVGKTPKNVNNPPVQKKPSQPAQPTQSTQAQHKGAEGNDFKAMKENWAKDRTDMLRANLLTMFDTDDDLPLSKHLLFLTIVTFFVLFITWATMAELDQLARGQGKVIPSQDVQEVDTAEVGTVEEFLVREGDIVQKGQVLMRLSDVQASSDLGSRSARYYGLLAAITRLQAEAEGKMAPVFPEEVMKAAPQSVTEELNTFRANQIQLSSQTSVLEQQLAQRNQAVRGLQDKVRSDESNLALIRQERSLIAPLVARGTAPKMELIQLDQRINQAKSDLNNAKSSLSQERSGVGEVRARITEIKSSAQAQAQSELSVKLVELNEIKETLGALTQSKERTVLTSPVYGKVQEITVKTVGGVVNPNEPVIKIIPIDGQLIIEAQIRPADIANIAEGMPAIVKITAYDFSIYGSLAGKVTEISADTVEDEQGNTFYRVRLETDEDKLMRGGVEHEIIPGMQASVDIITGEKTVLQYLMKPLIKTLDVAFTER